MITDILVVLLILIGIGTIVYWILKFAFWIVEKMIKKSDEKDNRNLIIELEKAKAEIKKRRDALDNDDLNDYKKCKMQGYSDSMGILDHRIKELKEGLNDKTKI